eukprot:scaffold8077_cov573-Pinguiococcus_pyrenoidosus.AAC.1
MQRVVESAKGAVVPRRTRHLRLVDRRGAGAFVASRAGTARAVVRLQQGLRVRAGRAGHWRRGSFRA